MNKNILIALLLVGVAVLGFFYYQSQQNTVEIELPKVNVN